MDVQGGYEEDRFISTVPPSLLCSICHEVLREPRLCKEGEHSFCLSCITKSLKRSKKCPMSKKHLTPETLVHPSACFKRVLGDLKIKCDYNERGCFSPIQLGNLHDHLSRCGFAPWTCEQCGMQINERDKDYHKMRFCPHTAFVKCLECKDIKENQQELKASLALISEELIETINDRDEFRRIAASINENQNDLKSKHVQTEKWQLEMKEQMGQVETAQNEQKVCQAEMKNEMKQIGKNQNEQKNDFREMTEQFKLFTAKFNPVAQQPISDFSSKGEIEGQISAKKRKRDDSVDEIENDVHEMKEPLVTEKFFNFSSSNNEIIIMGGQNDDETCDSVSIFNPANGTYAKGPPINYPRHGAASCVYNNDVIISGGCDGTALDTIEILKIDQEFPRWIISNGKLPFRLTGHVLKVYQEKVLVIGGFNAETREISNEIYEVAPAQPYIPTLLTTMPQPRVDHTADIVNDKLFILGGRKKLGNNEDDDGDDEDDDDGDDDSDVIGSVMMYDITTKEFKKCPSLPKAVYQMATVTWGSKIIVVGGRDQNRKVLNDVIMYDTKSGESETLPPLRHKRCRHSAVIINDVIVVFGGWNVEQDDLNSVESFTMGDNSWNVLPEMEDGRSSATAVVKP